MNQIDVAEAKSRIRGIIDTNCRDLSSKIGFLEPKLVVSNPIIGNLSF